MHIDGIDYNIIQRVLMNITGENYFPIISIKLIKSFTFKCGCTLMLFV